MGKKQKEFDMKLRTVEYVVDVLTLPPGMAWLEKKLQWIDHPELGKVLAPTLVKDGRFHTVFFTQSEIRGFALSKITGRIREGVGEFGLRLERGTAPKLKVTKAEGIE